MQTTTLDFPFYARRVYFAVKRVFETRTHFSNVKADDEHYTFEARRGWLVSPMSERIHIKVVATGSDRCRVTIDSSSRSILNLLNFGANKKNITNLSDFVQNEVWRVLGNDIKTIL